MKFFVIIVISFLGGANLLDFDFPLLSHFLIDEDDGVFEEDMTARVVRKSKLLKFCDCAGSFIVGKINKLKFIML